MKKETTALAKAIEDVLEEVIARVLDDVSQIVVDRVNTLVGTQTMAPIDTPVSEHTDPYAEPTPEAEPPKAEAFNTANMVAPAPVAPAPVAPAPVAPAPVAPAPVAPAPVAEALTHDSVRAQLLPIIQLSQEAMTTIHGVLTQQFAVNELTSLPVERLPEFMATVKAALPK